MSQNKTTLFFTLTKLLSLLLLLTPISALNSDGASLLALKYAILSDPNAVLTTWDYLDQTPCSWNGVVCNSNFDVITLALPDHQLLGTIPPDLGRIQHLQHLDLSNNFLNGTLPATLFNASSLKVLSLSSNDISGDIPVFSHSSLSFVNLSYNAFAGSLPVNFTAKFDNLTVLSLKGNYFYGDVPGGFPASLEVLDLSSNSFNGSLPGNLGAGPSLRYLNFSHNRISGEIPPEFVSTVQENATIDLSHNNLTGEVPGSKPLSGQNPGSFNGNQGLCGKPLKNLCVIPSTLSSAPNVSNSISPAIAVIPRPVGSSSGSGTGSGSSVQHNGLRPVAIVGIILADLAGVAILGVAFFYLYQVRKKKEGERKREVEDKSKVSDAQHFGGKKGGTMVMDNDHFLVQINSTAASNKVHTKCLSKCLRGHESEGTTTESRTSSESEDNGYADNGDERRDKEGEKQKNAGVGSGGGELVMVDGETELEVETLLKASAYVLGASGSSIVYKAVLQDGRSFAVRRLGEVGCDKVKDFEGHVKGIAKVRHPNVVRLCGFYWGSDEKLLIYDYISNGSLATSAYKKGGSTPYHLPLEVRLRIAKGVARGLSYIHEKRFVHANIKPSNILLTPDMEPVISDLGLSWLVYGKGSGSARQFGSKRSMGSYDGTQDLSVSGSPYINPFGSTTGAGSPYQAPETLKNLKPSPKWDVYSFGIVLLELLTGKVYLDLDRELGQWTPSSGLEDRYWVLRIADVALRAEIQGKEEAMMSIFKLGFSCASLLPQKRPSMKDALQVLEKASLSIVQ